MNTRGSRIQLEFLEVVYDKEERIAYLKNCGIRKSRRPATFIDVAANGGDRSNFSERFQNRNVPNIAGVNNQVATGQSGNRLGPQQAVGVGYETYVDDRSWHKRLLIPPLGEPARHAEHRDYQKPPRRGSVSLLSLKRMDGDWAAWSIPSAITGRSAGRLSGSTFHDF